MNCRVFAGIAAVALSLPPFAAIAKPVNWTCKFDDLNGPDAPSVTYSIDTQKRTLDGDPATISKSILTSRAKFPSGETITTTIDQTSGRLAIRGAGVTINGKCAIATDKPTPPSQAAFEGAAGLVLTAPQPKRETYVERETKAYVAESERVRPIIASAPELVTLFESYWQQRIENADRVDRGQLSPEAAAALNESYKQQLLAAVDQRQRAAQAQFDAQVQQLVIQQQAQQAQADADRRAQSMQMLQQGLQILAQPPPRPAGPVTCRWVGPNWVCQ